MALFTSTQFSGVSFDLPAGSAENPPNAATPVSLGLTDGTNVGVFDRVDTALKMMRQMRGQQQWQIWATDDVIIVSVSAQKLLLMESTFTNQKLLTSYLPVYQGDQVLWTHRSMSLQVGIEDALKSVGVRVTAPLVSNADLRTAKIPIQVVDWNYPNSLLTDDTPLAYDFTAPQRRL
jgi:hypothetical protein